MSAFEGRWKEEGFTVTAIIFRSKFQGTQRIFSFLYLLPNGIRAGWQTIFVERFPGK